MKARSGFTLLELLTVMLIIGILAAVAISRFWTVKERAYLVSMKDALRTASVQQERYFGTNMAYSNDPDLLPDYEISDGITVTITWTASRGWAATAEHASMPGRTCGYFTGPAPAGAAPPATEGGIIACDE
jgi:type IV pilus assembly protein PilA